MGIHPRDRAYLRGLGEAGCVAAPVSDMQRELLDVLGLLKGDVARLPHWACRGGRPRRLALVMDYVRGVFDAFGQYFDPDPHVDGPNIMLIFVDPPKGLAGRLRTLGLSPMATHDESRRVRYVVLFRRTDVAFFIRRVAPLSEVPAPMRAKVARHYL